MAEQNRSYVKLDEKGEIKRCPMNDSKGEITGKFVINLPAYFDEHPEERKRLGWIKRIQHTPKEIDYNRQTQYLQWSYKQIDEFTIEDVCEVIDKTEEMLLLEEINEAVGYGGGGIAFVGVEGEF